MKNFKSGFFLLIFSFLLVLLLDAKPLQRDTTIHIRAISGLQYDLVRFRVSPGAHVKIVLENDDDMAHNLLITAPQERITVVQEALKLGELGPKSNYVPASSKVLSFIPLLAPGETKELSFVAPLKEDVYPYVCTYPGHGFIMFGAMYVSKSPMPALKDDPNIPEQRKGQEIDPINFRLHPYDIALPALYRMFMPDSGPASIAVGLPGDISYCWDAGSCRLRYAWKGGFVDNMPHWKGNGNALARVIGSVFYREKAGFPFAFKNSTNIPKPEFKGYSIVDGFPKFEYQVGKITITEYIKSAGGGVGLSREFEIKGNKDIVFFKTHPDDGINYKTTKGKWSGNTLQLKGKESKQFTIIMEEKKGGLK